MLRTHVIDHISLDCKTFLTNCTGEFLVIFISAMNFFIMDLGLGGRCKCSVTFQTHCSAIVQVDQPQLHVIDTIVFLLYIFNTFIS